LEGEIKMKPQITQMTQIRIKEAAILVGTVYTGHNHAEVFRKIREAGIKVNKANNIQGFVTDDGSFTCRHIAAQVALDAGQIKNKQDILFSEDLW